MEASNLLPAYRSLRAAIRDQHMLSNEELEALLAEEEDLAAQKRLICGLYACCLINREQAGAQERLRPGLGAA